MKRLIACLLAVALLLPAAGCSVNMRGDTLELDIYSPDALLRTYEAVKNKEVDIAYSQTETLPHLRAKILNHAGKKARIINVYLYNESTYDMHVYGYMWFVSGKAQSKGIYYNAEKKVSNSTYKVKLDAGINGYFLYELLVDQPIVLDDTSTAFLFFKYEDTQYICGIDSEGKVAFWPKDQTLSA